MRVLVVLACVAMASAVTFPSAWTRCKAPPSKDNKRNKCMEQTINNIMRYLSDKNGEETLGLNDMDPLRIKKIAVGQNNPNSPVNLHIDLLDIDIYGLGEVNIKRVDGKLSSPKDWSIHILATAKQFRGFGRYKANGKFLVLPLVGQGKCNFTFDNVEAEAWVKGQSNVVDGVEYLKLTDRHLQVNTTKIGISLENLFNGDKLLAENMNKILNEHWQLLWSELRPNVERELIKSFVGYAKKIMEKIPYKDLIISEGDT